VSEPVVAAMPEWYGPQGWTPLPDLVRTLERNPTAFDQRPGAQAGADRLAIESVGIDVTDISIPGPHGPIPARLYRPADPVATLVWVHGGAFIFYSLDGPEAHHTSVGLAARGIEVLSVDYRKAINGVRYPIPSDDVLAGWLWACDNLSHGDGATPARMHLGGASAGGNLAAGVAKRLRDGAGPMPASVVLAYPFLGVYSEPSDVSSPDLFPNWWLEQMAVNYVGTEELLTNPYAFPINGDPAGFPATCLVLSDDDSIRPCGEAFASQLLAAGVRVQVDVETGTTHGQLDRPASPAADLTIQRFADWMLDVRWRR